MAAFGLLAVDNEYELTVVEIYERQGTPFIGKYEPNIGKTLYCHHFIMEDEDKIQYKCQVCEQSDTQNWCNIGDVMSFNVKAFTREIHTIEFLSRDGQPVRNTAFIKEAKKEIVKEISAGLSPKSIALLSASIFFSNRIENDEESVLKKAKEFEKYLTE